MNDRERAVFVAALEHYGPDSQTKMLLEEMSELQKEICKYWRGLANYDAIAEEIADVSILLDQMCLLFQCGGAVQRWRLEKSLRLAERIGEGSQTWNR